MKLLSHSMGLAFHHHILTCRVWARGSAFAPGLHLGCAFMRKAYASSGLIQNFEPNRQLFGKMSILKFTLVSQNLPLMKQSILSDPSVVLDNRILPPSRWHRTDSRWHRPHTRNIDPDLLPGHHFPPWPGPLADTAQCRSRKQYRDQG